MSVLIKGMEMPTSCYDCNCFIRDSDGSDYCCLLMQDIVDNNKRDDDGYDHGLRVFLLSHFSPQNVV